MNAFATWRIRTRSPHTSTPITSNTVVSAPVLALTKTRLPTGAVGVAGQIAYTVVIANTTGNGLDVTGGNGTFSVGAPISTSSGHSVSVVNRTGGTTDRHGARV